MSGTMGVRGLVRRRGTEWEARIYVGTAKRPLATIRGSWGYVERGLAAVGLAAGTLAPVGLGEMELGGISLAAEDVGEERRALPGGRAQGVAKAHDRLVPEPPEPALETADLRVADS